MKRAGNLQVGADRLIKRRKKKSDPETNNNNNFDVIRKYWNVVRGCMGIQDLELIVLDYWVDDLFWKVTTHPHTHWLRDQNIWEIEFLSPRVAYICGLDINDLVEYQVDSQTQEISWNLDTRLDLSRLLSGEDSQYTVAAMPNEDEFFAADYDSDKDIPTTLLFFNLKGEIKKRLPLTTRYDQFVYLQDRQEILAAHKYVKKNKTGYATDILDANTGVIKHKIYPTNGFYTWTQSFRLPLLAYNNREILQFQDDWINPQKICGGPSVNNVGPRVLFTHGRYLYSCGTTDEDHREIFVYRFPSMLLIDRIQLIQRKSNLHESAHFFVAMVELTTQNQVLMMDRFGYAVISSFLPSKIIV
jgi:hypothetical protein